MALRRGVSQVVVNHRVAIVATHVFDAHVDAPHCQALQRAVITQARGTAIIVDCAIAATNEIETSAPYQQGTGKNAGATKPDSFTRVVNQLRISEVRDLRPGPSSRRTRVPKSITNARIYNHLETGLAAVGSRHSPRNRSN